MSKIMNSRMARLASGGLLAWLMSMAACGPQVPIPGQKKSDAGGDDSTETAMAAKSEVDGVVTSTFDPASQEVQVLKASGSSAIKDASIVFPPGALAVPTDITIGEGEPLTAANVAGDLGLGADATVSEAGPAVVISSSEGVNASLPFTVVLPVGNGGSLALQSGHLVVLRRTYNSATGVVELGIMPAGELSEAGDKVSVQTIYFGAYQAVYSSVAVEKEIAVATAEPILAKKRTSELVGKWQKSCDNRTWVDASGTTKSDGSRRESISFGDTDFSFVHADYLAADCADAPSEFNITGKYAAGGLTGDAAGSSKIDITLTAWQITLRSEREVEHFNTQQACGRTDWEFGVTKVFRGNECAGFFDSDKKEGAGLTAALPLLQDGASSVCVNDKGPGELGVPIYTIYKVTDDHLVLGCSSGPEHDGSSPEKREDILKDGPGMERVQ